MKKNGIDINILFRIYDLAKKGHTKKEIVAITKSETPDDYYIINNKLHKQAYAAGKSFTKENGGNFDSFKDYVIDRLPLPIKEVWDRIAVLERTNGVEKIEAIFEDGGKLLRQYIFIHAFIASNFNLSASLKKANISLTQYNNWKDDFEFGQMVETLNRYKKDFFENQLIAAVQRGETPAIIFANKTYNKDLGYNEKVDVSVEGTVNVNHTIIDIEDLELSLETKKEILESHRKLQQKVKG